MSPTRWSITDINKTLEKFNEMMVGWILLCHNLADMACLQKDIETSWIFVVDIELGTVNTQLTWPGIILLKSVTIPSKYYNGGGGCKCLLHEFKLGKLGNIEDADLQCCPNCSHPWTQMQVGTYKDITNV